MVVPVSNTYAFENYRRELEGKICYWNSLESNGSPDKKYDAIAFIVKELGKRTTYVHKILKKYKINNEDHPRKEYWSGFVKKKYLIEFEKKARIIYNTNIVEMFLKLNGEHRKKKFFQGSSRVLIKFSTLVNATSLTDVNQVFGD